MGFVLVLLYGFLIVLWDWYKVWLMFSVYYWVLIFDFIGFGFLDKFCDYVYFLVDQVDFIEEFLKVRGIWEYYLLVYDYGDFVV